MYVTIKCKQITHLNANQIQSMHWCACLCEDIYIYIDVFIWIYLHVTYTEIIYIHEGKNSPTGCSLTTVTEYNFESNRMLPVLGESKHANHIEFVWICTSLTCPFAKCKGDMLVSYKPRLNENTHPSPNNECCHTNAPQRQSSILLNFFTSRFLPNMLSSSYIMFISRLLFSISASPWLHYGGLAPTWTTQIFEALRCT